MDVVDDADELARSGGDDLLARERGSAALDQHAARGRLIGAVDVEVEITLGVEIRLAECRGFERSEVWRELETAPSSWILRSFSTSMNSRHRRARADAEHHARFDVGYRGLRGTPLLFGCRENFPTP